MAKYNILIADDDDENLSSTRNLLQRWGYDVDTVSTGEEAIDCVRGGSKQYAVALIDYQMPGKNGAETSEEIRSISNEIVILIYSAYPTVDSLKSSIRAGAINFIEKSEDIEYLKKSIAQACIEHEKVRTLRPLLTTTEYEKQISSIGMVGRSASLADVVERVHRYRSSKKTVLVMGETGVGKELVAKAIHNGRSDTFFPINCAAFENSSLIESELFGYEKGAFTGASNRKAGIFEIARGGTIFLDELPHLPMGAQAKLLRVLREKKIRRVGGQQEIDVDFRLVVAAHPNIEEKVANGMFLPDLYYRIKFLSIEIPPLRQRVEDIEPLITSLCEKHNRETGQKKTFLVKTIRQMEKYRWPGNVGELDGCVSALLMNSDKETIDVHQLEPKFVDNDEMSLNSKETYAQLEAKQDHEKRQFLMYVIKGSKSLRHAAQKMGIKPSSLHALIDRLDLRSKVQKEEMA
ncbi:MAG: sigma-54 dependent transcriptional regulator [Bdellovibrionales bacterium]|nr:sigma-54 dependent transcriptional regulator [Bdellovibrionales bacterium]